jgi:hypothetical protein
VTLDLDAELAEPLEAGEREAETRRVLERLQGRLVQALRLELDAAVDELAALRAPRARPLVAAAVARALRATAITYEPAEPP